MNLSDIDKKNSDKLKDDILKFLQGYSQIMRLQQRLYENYSVLFLILAKSARVSVKHFIQCRRQSSTSDRHIQSLILFG